MTLQHEYDKPRVALGEAIAKEIARNGPNCSLNHLDVSGVKTMAALFEDLDFNGDISKWDVSHVQSMQWMFKNSSFNGDISQWNTRHVFDMTSMFESCPFTGDISNWDVSNARRTARMFMRSSFNGDLSKWDVSRVQEMSLMFAHSSFNQPIDAWQVGCAKDLDEMFLGSDFNQDIGPWRIYRGASLNNLFFASAYKGCMPTIDLQDYYSSTRVLDDEYRGDFQNKYNLAEARTLFGTKQLVDAYLLARVQDGHLLDRLHIEKIVTSNRKPLWATKEVVDWLRSEQAVHQTLNIPLPESLILLHRSYQERFLGQPQVAVESIALDFDSAS